MQTQKRTVLSGIQPSGLLTLGGYIGALQSWLEMQHTHECLFMLADLHAITVLQDPIQLRARCYDFLALYVACGIDPERNILFAQSHVSAHTQLAWILNCYAYVGELNRMTQFKDKSKQHAVNVNMGLFDYPVLMAADILVYGTHLVPVGDDQKQHLELTRDLATRFNRQYDEAIFVIPEPYIPKQGARIMSLQVPTKKMSKSDPNVNSYIALLDEPDNIVQKFKRATTDSGNEIFFSEQKPGISNLLVLLSTVTGKMIQALESEYAGVGYGQFKMDVADAVIAYLEPIQKRYHEIRADQAQLQALLKKGAQAAQSKAQPLLDKIYAAIGLLGR